MVSEKKARPVVVTTAHRGVFFGYATDTDGETIRMEQSRLCVYWSTATATAPAPMWSAKR